MELESLLGRSPEMEHQRPLSRRALLETTAAKALLSWGVYESLVGGGVRVALGAPPASKPPEQHLLPGMSVRTLPSGARVIVQPTFFQIVTARLRVDEDAVSLHAAQEELEHVLARLDSAYATSPSGLGLAVGWGLPYFRRYVPGPAAANLPLDVTLSKRAGREVSSLLDAIRFPSDPAATALEENDVAFLFRSDVKETINDANDRIFAALADLLQITTIRKGFSGAGLPRTRATAARLPVARHVARNAPLFFGAYPLRPFGEGPSRIANVETLGYATRVGYFRFGTHMHVSHLFEDADRFYAISPSRRGELLLGHGFAISRRTGLRRSTVGADGHRYSANSGLIQRCYASTLDNPFFWSSKPGADRWGKDPAVGLHFVSFAPTTHEFHRYRLAMDGRDDHGNP